MKFTIVQPSYHSRHRTYSMEYISTHRVQLLHIVTENNPKKCLCGRNPDSWYKAYRTSVMPSIDEILALPQGYCKQCISALSKIK